MKLQNLSVRAFLRKIVAGTLLTAALLLLIFFLLTKDVRVVICGIILTAAFFIWGMVFLHYFQKKLSLFTDGLCQTLDHMMDSTDRPQVDYEAETLLSRISHRLERLYNVMQKTRHTAEVEKEELQSLVSDISHQTKHRTLRDALIGETVTVGKLAGEGPVRRRIMDMGVTKGTQIFIRKVAPLGDPIEVTVRGYELSIRKSEAENIHIH